MIKNIIINNDIYNMFNLAYLAGYNIKYIDKNSVKHRPVYQLLDKQYKELNYYSNTNDKNLCDNLSQVLDDISSGIYTDKPDKIKVYFKKWCILFIKSL